MFMKKFRKLYIKTLTVQRNSLVIQWLGLCSSTAGGQYSGLISLRIDWFALLAVQGIFKSLLSTTFLQYQFFGAQPSFWSNSHTCTWLLVTEQTFIGKVMSLLFNRLSRFVIAFILLFLFFFLIFRKGASCDSLKNLSFKKFSQARSKIRESL